MNWNAIGALGQVVAATAVVVSIIYLSMQIRQNTQTTKLEAERDIALHLAKSLQDAAPTKLPGIFVRASTDPSTVTEDELAQFGFYVLGFFRLVQHAYDQRLEGNLSDRTWESVEVFLATQLRAPGVRAIWKIRGETYKREFQNYVNSLQIDESYLSPVDALTKLREKAE